MIPKDLAGFSIEQLRGFQTAVKLAIEAVRPEAKSNPEKLEALETLIDERDQLNTAIEAALSAVEAADGAEETETPEGAEAGSDESNTEDGDGTSADADADAVVDEAVASAELGGGQGPKVTNEPAPGRAGDMRKFIRAMSTGEVRGEHRASFATMQRETNHKLNEGGTVNKELLDTLRADRKSGDDKTAAGCFCGPDEARNEIVYSGQTTRPLSDTLPTLTVAGDYRFIRQIPLISALAGVTEDGWFCADQDAVDPALPATWKPCMDLDCQTEITSETYAVAACSSFNVQQMIGNPALIDNLEHVMQVAFNHVAEMMLYGKLLDNAGQYDYGLTTPTGYGASAQIIAAVAWAMELIRQNVRSTPQGYALAVPAGTRERILGDGMIRATDDYRTWDDMQTRLAELGVDQIVEMIDPIGPVTALAVDGAAPAAAVAHTLERQLLLYKPEDFLLGVNPEVDLGIMRSPEMARQNKVQWFTESFESVEKVGIEPAVALNMDLCTSGVRPAFGEGTVCEAPVG